MADGHFFALHTNFRSLIEKEKLAETHFLDSNNTCGVMTLIFYFRPGLGFCSLVQVLNVYRESVD